MAFVQIRGVQIQDAQIQDRHIDPNTAIAESKLAISWHNHTEALQDRKIVIPVQVNNLSLSGASIDVTSQMAGNVAVLSGNTAEGYITDAPNNKVAIRNTDDTIYYITVAGAQYELYGRLTYAGGATPVWTLSFFYKDSVGTETAYTVPAQATPPVVIGFFSKRQNLVSMDEMVLAGYRFMVQDAVDATTGANVDQLAADIYGPNYSLTGNGVPKLQRSLAAEISLQTSGVVNTTVRANSIIDEVIKARATYADVDGRFANLENQMSTANANISSVTTTANATNTEVVNARTNAAATPVTYANLKARLDAMDSDISSINNGGSTTQTEVTAARVTSVAQQTGAYITEASLEDRLVADFNAVVSQISTEATDRQTAVSGVQTNLDNFKADLANSTDNTKGATLVGVDSLKLTSKTVLAALDELHDLVITDTKGTVHTDVTASTVIDDVTDALSNGAATPTTYTSLRARFNAIEGNVSTLQSEIVGSGANSGVTASQIIDEVIAAREGAASLDAQIVKVTSGATNTSVRASEVIDEVVAARGSAASLEARLAVAINADGTLVNGTKIHVHKKYVYHATGGETAVSLPNGGTFQAGDDSCDVHVNGVLQVNTVNYTEITPATPNGTATGVSFNGTTLMSGDYVVLKYYLNDAQ